MRNKIGLSLLIIFGLVAIVGMSVRQSKASAAHTAGVKERAWATLESYLEAAKNRDIETIKALSYKLSLACTDKARLDDCNARMNTVYVFGILLKKEEFTNVWYDSRQIILATDFQTIPVDKAVARARSIIFFKIEDGLIKVIRFNPSQSAFLPLEGDNSDSSMLEPRLIELTVDSDNDGVADYTEKCEGANESAGCIKTNPNRRDSDRDGLWDGTELEMQK
jgi:hypothetical protein